jgi:lipopolysaccharide/colanic/teichoic acid biosynthesis glycosyltransferase
VAALFPAHHWKEVAHLRPGLSGIGSIVFRDEEDLLEAAEDRERVYSTMIVPYKMALEKWYAGNVGLVLDLKLVAITAIAVVSRGIDVSRILHDLPPPPDDFVALKQKCRGRDEQNHGAFRA